MTNPNVSRATWTVVLFSSAMLAMLPGCSEKVGGGPRPGVDAGTGSGSMDAGGPPLAPDPCNNVDDNGNGLVDEGCTCTVGTTQPCWTGDPGRRNVGACRDGIQHCQQFGEFTQWGECLGAALPQPELEFNCADEDCDGSAARSDEGSEPCVVNCGEFENCNNGADDECDGLIDCDDPECSSAPHCVTACVPTAEVCTDGRDNDCDTIVDCADTDCSTVAGPCMPPPPPPPGCMPEFPFLAELWCGDTRDNDCDMKVDCADPDCHSPGNCGCQREETACTDGMDEDCDGDTDCSDLDCQVCVPGTWRWCDEPMYCHWGKQNCGSDQHWGACTETLERPGTCSGSIYDKECCVDAGGCCQDFPEQESIGMCTGISSCAG